MRWPDVAEVEVNPLFVYEDRAVPVDARVVLAPHTPRPDLAQVVTVSSPR